MPAAACLRVGGTTKRSSLASRRVSLTDTNPGDLDAPKPMGNWMVRRGRVRRLTVGPARRVRPLLHRVPGRDQGRLTARRSASKRRQPGGPPEALSRLAWERRAKPFQGFLRHAGGPRYQSCPPAGQAGRLRLELGGRVAARHAVEASVRPRKIPPKNPRKPLRNPENRGSHLCH